MRLQRADLGLDTQVERLGLPRAAFAICVNVRISPDRCVHTTACALHVHCIDTAYALSLYVHMCTACTRMHVQVLISPEPVTRDAILGNISAALLPGAHMLLIS